MYDGCRVNEREFMGNKTNTVTFPDGGKWTIDGKTITYTGPVAEIAARSPFHFPTELAATVAWLEVCMK